MRYRPFGRGVEPPNTSDTAATRERGGEKVRQTVRAEEDEFTTTNRHYWFIL